MVTLVPVNDVAAGADDCCGYVIEIDPANLLDHPVGDDVVRIPVPEVSDPTVADVTIPPLDLDAGVQRHRTFFAVEGGPVGASKAPLATVGLAQEMGRAEVSLGRGGDHHLGNVVTLGDDVVRGAEVDQDDPDLSAVVAVNGSWTVEDRDPVLGSEAGTGADLTLKTGRDLDEEAGWDNRPRGASLKSSMADWRSNPAAPSV